MFPVYIAAFVGLWGLLSLCLSICYPPYIECTKTLVILSSTVELIAIVVCWILEFEVFNSLPNSTQNWMFTYFGSSVAFLISIVGVLLLPQAKENPPSK